MLVTPLFRRYADDADAIERSCARLLYAISDAMPLSADTAL